MAGTKKLKKYSSKKHPVLEYVFLKYYDPRSPQQSMPFYLSDISEGYRKKKIPEPASISNTILDLTRRDRGINSRVPKSISSLGYDVRKKTGADTSGHMYAGEFVQVGNGNSLRSWLLWPDVIPEVIVDSSSVPTLVKLFVRPDEAGLFSIIDYTDAFSKVFQKSEKKVYRIQNPMKWQPNEIDGFYATGNGDTPNLYPVEAKALATGDEINLDQLQGGFATVLAQMKRIGLKGNIQQIAVKMRENGLDIAVFPANEIPEIPEEFFRVRFEPTIHNWVRPRSKKRMK